MSLLFLLLLQGFLALPFFLGLLLAFGFLALALLLGLLLALGLLALAFLLGFLLAPLLFLALLLGLGTTTFFLGAFTLAGLGFLALAFGLGFGLAALLGLALAAFFLGLTLAGFLFLAGLADGDGRVDRRFGLGLRLGCCGRLGGGCRLWRRSRFRCGRRRGLGVGRLWRCRLGRLVRLLGCRQILDRDPQLGLDDLGLGLLPADADEQQRQQADVHQQGQQEGERAAVAAAPVGAVVVSHVRRGQAGRPVGRGLTIRPTRAMPSCLISPITSRMVS